MEFFFTSAQNALDARVADDSEKAGAIRAAGSGGQKLPAFLRKTGAKIKLSSIKSVCEDLEIFAERTLPDLQNSLMRIC